MSEQEKIVKCLSGFNYTQKAVFKFLQKHYSLTTYATLKLMGKSMSGQTYKFYVSIPLSKQSKSDLEELEWCFSTQERIDEFINTKWSEISCKKK